MKQYKHTPVFYAGWFFDMFNKDLRGMALGWFILIRRPNMFDDVYSSSGHKKYLYALLEHEYTHITRQIHYGRFKWFYKYITDAGFHKKEEEIAISRETHYNKKEYSQ